jgi:hypothetical protein
MDVASTNLTLKMTTCKPLSVHFLLFKLHMFLSQKSASGGPIMCFLTAPCRHVTKVLTRIDWKEFVLCFSISSEHSVH